MFIYIYEHLWTFSVSVWICLLYVFISWLYFWTSICNGGNQWPEFKSWIGLIVPQNGKQCKIVFNWCYIIVEGFFLYYHFFVGYILSFGLVRFRTVQLSAWVGAHIERREDVTITDVIIKIPDRKWTGDVNDVMPGSDGLRILGDFWKKAELRFEPRWSELIFGPGQGQSSHRSTRCIAWSDGTVSIVKIVSLSPRVENPKVKKVISFVPELKSRQCFAYFGIPMHVNILHIVILAVCYTYRIMEVKIYNNYSETQNILSCVPHGTILGPFAVLKIYK